MKKIIFLSFVICESFQLWASDKRNPLEEVTQEVNKLSLSSHQQEVSLNQLIWDTREFDGYGRSVDGTHNIYPCTFGNLLEKGLLPAFANQGNPFHNLEVNQAIQHLGKTWKPENKGFGAFAICKMEDVPQNFRISHIAGYIFLTKDWQINLAGGYNENNSIPMCYALWHSMGPLTEEAQILIPNALKTVFGHISHMVQIKKINRINVSCSLQTTSAEAKASRYLMNRTFDSLVGKYEDSRIYPAGGEFLIDSDDNWKENKQWRFAILPPVE